MRVPVANFCPYCGLDNRLKDPYCKNCGSALRLPDAYAAPPGPAAAGQQPWYPYQAGGYQPRRASAEAMISGTFHLFGKDALAYFGTFLIYGVILALLTLAMTYIIVGSPFWTTTPYQGFNLNLTTGLILRILLAALIVGIVSAIIGSILVASLTHFAYQRFVGKELTLRQAFGEGLRRFISIIGASLVMTMITTGLLIAPIVIILAGVSPLDFGLIFGGLLLMLALIPIVIYLTIALNLYAPAIMVEGKTAVAGLRRSWELTRGKRGTIFAGLFVIVLFTGVIGSMATLPFIFVNDPYVRSIGTVISTAITGAWSLIFSVVAYRLIMGEREQWQNVTAAAPTVAGVYGEPPRL